MRVLQTLLSVVFISTASSHSLERRESSEKRVVCYYTNWSVYRPGTAKYNPQNINPYLCTHLIYAFGGLDRENGLRPYDKYQDIEQGGYAKFTGLKSYNKNLKTMLAIGGWNEGSARFSPLVADEDRRKEFVKNVVKFLRVNHFDGLDLDWEYPAFRDGGKARDRDNYAQLVQELREEFDREHDKTGRPRLLLTMAVPAGIEYIDKGYDVPKLNRYLDFMNILSYDYHSAFEPAVNHHSPLHPLEEDNEYNFDAQLSIDYTVQHYLKAGADRDKLVLGIPTYGRSYTLFNPDSTDIGAPADGPGEQGDATREKGYLAYYEICGALKSQDDWTVVQPKPKAMGPYAYRDNQWVGYDDVDIVKLKAQYVNEQGLGGIMFWSIDNDDFRGKCHDRPYPLIEAAKEALYASTESINNLVSSSNKREKTTSLVPSRRPSKPVKPKSPRTTTTTPAPPKAASSGQTTPEPPTTPDPGSDFVCKDEGFFPHPRDCKKYFWCLDSGPSNLGIVAHQFTCPSGLFFNKAADSCDYTRNVLCNKKEKSTTAAPKVTAATAKTTVGRLTTTTTTTTTTTEAPVEEEYEEEEEEHEQEDPEAIKQLIQLIKKLGGVAELEKQLEGAGGSGVSTPSIPRSLYNKVLTPQRPKYQSPYRNGPSGPQNEGLSQKDDGASYRRDKPQYVTIRRDRPSTEAPSEEAVESETPSTRVKYTSIQRNRPSNQYEVEEEPEEDISPRPVATSPRYQTIERNRPSRPGPSVEEPEEDPSPRPVATSPRYQTIERNRPSRPGPSVEEEEEPEEPSRPKYSSVQRSRTTTVEAVVESTTPRYVTLRRQRPQVEQQQEESTIKHTGETIVIEEEEEIKPIEIDVEEPISTSVRPKPKVSVRPVTSTSTTERLYIVTAESSAPTEEPTTVVMTESSPLSTLTTESNTDVTETETFPTESSSVHPTTVPYQTSTLTSIVTVVVEGATERRRVPITKLKQALADHDLLTNSLTADSKIVPGKSSVLDKPKEEGKEVDKSDESNRYRPIGSYRGRPKKPLVFEPPTTKALPLYLQRRRTTTTTEAPVGDFAPTEESQSSTKTRTFGRFTPSRTRDNNRIRPSSTQSSVVDDYDTSTAQTNRYRTARPSTASGSRFVTSRGRTRTTTASPDSPVGDKRKRKPYGRNDEVVPENSVDDSKSIDFGNKDKENGESPELVPEKPTRVFGRGRIRTTTEKVAQSSDIATTTARSTSKSRFLISRGRNRTYVPNTQRTRLSQVTTERSIDFKNSTGPSLGRSRFQILRRRNLKNETDNTSVNNTTENKLEESNGVNNTSSEEEHELLISQENLRMNPSQLFTSDPNKTVLDSLRVELTTLSNILVNSIYPSNASVENSTGLSVELTTLSNILVNSTDPSNSSVENSIGTLKNETDSDTKVDEAVMNKTNLTELDLVNSTTEAIVSFTDSIRDSNDSELRDSVFLQGGFLNNTKDPENSTYSVSVLDIGNENDTFDDNLPEEEVLNVIASRYSEQSFTGRRGSVRFQGSSGTKEGEQPDNSISNSGKKVNLVQSRRRKVNTTSVDKPLPSSKSNEDSNTSTRRRKVLVRKNKVTLPTEGVFESTTQSLARNTVRSRSFRDRNNDFFREKSSDGNDKLDKVNQTKTQVSFRSRNPGAKQRTVNNNVESSTDLSDQKLRKSNSGEKELGLKENVRRRKVKVLKSRNQVNNFEDEINRNQNVIKRRVIVKKKARKDSDTTTDEQRQTLTRRGLRRFPEKDISDLDTGTSLYVHRETESDDVLRGSFTRSVKDQPRGNFLVRDPTSRGKTKAKDSLSEDISGVTGDDEDSSDDLTDQSEVGGNRVRVTFRRPVTSTARTRLSTTTEAAVVSERPTAKFFRRRVSKFRPDQKNVTVFVSAAATSPIPEIFATTVKQRRFEFPRRTVRPNINSLPQQAALVATATPFVEINDNHSDESLHEVDTQTVESKEVYDGLEEATLPDLANVAVAAIQSLATVPPSTETFAPVTVSTHRRQTPRTTTTTTTTVRPTPNTRRGPPRPFSKISPSTIAPKSQFISRHNPYDDLAPDYGDYYAEPVDIPLSGKVRIHNDGYIECLDIGNFPHPFACKKFISCAKMESEHLLGWEYTCPKGLSFDPIGGICNWSAGLGCKE